MDLFKTLFRTTIGAKELFFRWNVFAFEGEQRKCTPPAKWGAAKACGIIIMVFSFSSRKLLT